MCATNAFAQAPFTPFQPPPIAPVPNEPGLEAMQPGAVRGARPLVVDVILRGNVNEEKARSFIRTKREYEFDPATLNADVRRLMSSNLYQDVRTFTRDVAEGVVVIIELTGRPKMNYLEFHGNRGFTDKKLIKTCELKVGEPLNAFDVEEGRRKIEEQYHTKGYPKAQVGILEGDKASDQGVVYMISEGYLQRISAVTFEGNTFASDGVLKTKIESKPGYFWYFIRGKMSREKLDADVQKLTAYYHDFGFFRARVGRELTFDEEGRWVSIKFIIDEGQRYNVRNVQVVGNEVFHSQPLVDALTLKSNKPFSNAEMQKDLNLLRDLYGSQGRIFAQVEANPRFVEQPGQVDLVYKIQEGEPFHVGQINVHIAGEFPHTRRNVVLNKLSLKPGDLIDIRQVRDSERRLKFSQLFETEQEGGEPPRIVVRPPELNSDAFAGTGGSSGVRGQNPDMTSTQPATQPAAPYRVPHPTYDLDVYVECLHPDVATVPMETTSAVPHNPTFRPLPPVEMNR
jgi:outer membrane protein insertion porin family